MMVKNISWRRVETIVLLGAMSAFAPLSTDMYLPALPSLERAFHASTTQVQLTLASFFTAFALGQAFYGPVIDRFGRKPPLYASLALFAVASVGCALAWSIHALVVLRFVQALGACAGGVIARAMVRDSFDPLDAARIYSALMLVSGLAPMLAPLVGGYVLLSFGWRAIFWLLSILGISCLLAVSRRLPETQGEKGRARLDLSGVAKGYVELLTDRRYLGYALTGGLSMAGMFAYIAGSPYVFIELFSVPADRFGLIFGMNAVGLVTAGQINGRLVRRYGPMKLMETANFVQMTAGLVLLALGGTGTGSLMGILVPLFVYIACLGFILPNTTALAMAPFGSRAGTASALLGTLQFTIAAVASTLIGILQNGSVLPMVGTIAACGVIGLGLQRSLVGDRVSGRVRETEPLGSSTP